MPMNLGERAKAQSILQRLPETKYYYGWMIVAVCLLSSFTWTATFNPILGVFMKPLGDEFGWNRTTVSWASSAASLVGGFMGPVVGPILDKRGPRIVLVVASLIAGVCLIGLYWLSSLWQFYLLYGIVRLTTVGGSQLAISVAVANWFVRKRGRATGISALGQRLGMVTLPFMTQYLIVAFDWRIAWVALGAIVIATGTFPAALFMRRRPEDFGLRPDGVPDPGPVIRQTSGQAHQSGEEVSWTLKEALRTRAFWLLTMAVAQGMLVGGAINLHLVPYLSDRGLSDSTAVGIFSLYSIAGAGSSLFWGFAMERLSVRRSLIIIFVGSAVGTGILMLVDSPPLAVVFAILYGIAFGGHMVLISVVFAEYFGRRHVGAISGFAAPLERIANALGPVLAGFVYDVTKSYQIAFVIFLILYALSALWMILARRPVAAPAAMPSH
ncbi:MAG: MFS transporter [Chloroflexi bacterium]|nr:MFS transporter [Chloroflexota bacterium]